MNYLLYKKIEEFLRTPLPDVVTLSQNPSPTFYPHLFTAAMSAIKLRHKFFGVRVSIVRTHGIGMTSRL